MKTLGAQARVVVKAGSVSLAEARAAARAARSGQYLRLADDESKESAGLWERYLGHFGSSAKLRTGKKAKTAKKSSGKKASAKKPKLAAKTYSTKKYAAKRYSAKKASAKKR